MFEMSERPWALFDNFRNSETHVPQNGEINNKNSGLLSSRKSLEEISPVSVISEISGKVSFVSIWGKLAWEHPLNINNIISNYLPIFKLYQVARIIW